MRSWFSSLQDMITHDWISIAHSHNGSNKEQDSSYLMDAVSKRMDLQTSLMLL